jgi:hypothetical protein
VDILAAIASDPSVLPLWLVLAFAAGMYPVGMLFSCQVCCNYCLQCCPDRPEQVVIDFHLEEAGEQVVKATPWRMFDQSFGFRYHRFDPLDEIADTAFHDDIDRPYGVYTPENIYGYMPTFIATGDTSGARRMLVSQIYFLANDTPPGYGENRYRPVINTIGSRSMGPAFTTNTRYEFLEESVSVSSVPPATAISGPDLSFQLTPGSGGCTGSFAGDPGSYSTEITPEADYKVLCQGDEGTVIYDITDGRPDGCNKTCVPGLVRTMNHPANCKLALAGDGGLSPTGQAEGSVAEVSQLTIAVNVLRQRQEFIAGDLPYTPPIINTCSDNLTATATTYWTSALPGAGRIFPDGSGEATQAWCQTVRTYTLDTTEQDCAPFEDWPYTDVTTDSDGEYEDELVRLTIASCFGSGFAGRATEPAGVPGEDDGPITALDIQNAGTGYAVPGRVEPTVTIDQPSGGTGAEFAVVFSEGSDECGRPVWSIDSVEVSTLPGDDGGVNYGDGTTLYATVDAPGTEVAPASLTARVVREEPELDIYSYATGENAEITFTYTENAGPPKTWSPVSATIDNPGSGYQFGEYVDLVPKTGADQWAGDFSLGYAEVETVVSQPTVSLSGGSGSSASLSVTLASNGGSPETWGISSISIVNGGAGYVAGDSLSIDLGVSDIEQLPASVTVASVDESGAITGLTVAAGGEYYYESGNVAALNIIDGSQYFRSTGEIESVEVNDGGSFYLDDEDEPAIVADITVEVEQLSPSAGSGLEVSAVVDDDVHSPTFGQITGLTIDDGGSNYLAIHEEPSVCHVGAPYRRAYATKITTLFPSSTGMFECDDFSGDPLTSRRRGFLFRRRCPDYTYQISLQSGSS